MLIILPICNFGTLVPFPCSHCLMNTYLEEVKNLQTHPKSNLPLKSLRTKTTSWSWKVSGSISALSHSPRRRSMTTPREVSSTDPAKVHNESSITVMAKLVHICNWERGRACELMSTQVEDRRGRGRSRRQMKCLRKYNPPQKRGGLMKI